MLTLVTYFQIYNLGTGTGYSVLEAVKAFEKVYFFLDFKSRLVSSENPRNHKMLWKAKTSTPQNIFQWIVIFLIFRLLVVK